MKQFVRYYLRIKSKCMKVTYLFNFIILILLGSCISKELIKEANEKFVIDINRQDKITNFFNAYHTIALETTPNNLIGGIDKIVLQNEHIYILDKKQATIFIFTHNGKYQNKIANQGRAPGEYLSISDFEVYDSHVYCLSRTNQKIFKYDTNGVFQNTIQVNDWYDCFHIQNDNTIYLFSDYSNNQLYNYVVYNPITKEIINRLDKFKKNQGFSFEYSPFHCLDSNLLVSEQYEHTIFSLTSQEKKPLYSFIFNTSDQIPPFIYTDREKTYHFLQGKETLRRIKGLYISQGTLNIVYSIFYKNSGIKDFISKIDTATKEVKTIKLGDDFFPEYPFLYSAFCVYQDQIISYIPALLALNVDKQYGLNQFTSISLKETDNPVLIFHHLK